MSTTSTDPHRDGAAYIHAPFTIEQIQALHAYQDSGSGQPFTCPNAGNGAHHLDERAVGQLVATRAGWACRDCDFEQDWARAYMADPTMTAWAQEVLGQ